MPEPVQRTVAILGLVLIAPVLGVLAILVRSSGSGGALYRATRAAPTGTFTCYKLRTMVPHDGAPGPAITAADDPRVTHMGRLLRRTRLDELPQLWNVVRGDMLLVGPRPEDPRYVDRSIPLHRYVFDHKPGITGITQLAFAEEARLLDGPDLERRYREVILPAKLALDARYLQSRTARLDLWILARTLGIVFGSRPSPGEVERQLGAAESQGDGDGATSDE